MTKRELINKLAKYDDGQEIYIINPLIEDKQGGSPAFEIVGIFEDDWELDDIELGITNDRAVALIFTDNYLFNGEYEFKDSGE